MPPFWTNASHQLEAKISRSHSSFGAAGSIHSIAAYCSCSPTPLFAAVPVSCENNSEAERRENAGPACPAEDGDTRRAVIYDFKTNVKREGESKEAFENRLRETYEGQMARYGASLAKLTGIPQSRIEAKLLASATMSVIPVRTPTAD